MYWLSLACIALVNDVCSNIYVLYIFFTWHWKWPCWGQATVCLKMTSQARPEKNWSSVLLEPAIMPVRGIRGTTHWLPVTWEVTGTSQCSTFNNHSGGTTLIGGHGSLIRPFAFIHKWYKSLAADLRRRNQTKFGSQVRWDANLTLNLKRDDVAIPVDVAQAGNVRHDVRPEVIPTFSDTYGTPWRTRNLGARDKPGRGWKINHVGYPWYHARNN